MEEKAILGEQEKIWVVWLPFSGRAALEAKETVSCSSAVSGRGAESKTVFLY